MKPRLLIVELHHLGDTVMSLPFVRAAQQRYEVHVLCRPCVAPIYRLLSDAPQIHEWEPPWANEQNCGAIASVRAANQQGRVLRKQQLDVAVCVWADARAQILMAATGARQRIGFPMTRGNYYAADVPWRAKRLLAGWLAEKLWTFVGPARPLLTTRLRREDQRQHHLYCWEQVAEAAGVTCDYSAPWITVRPSKDVLALKDQAASAGKKLLAVHTNARLPSKQWPAEKWRALCALPSVRAAFELCELVPAGSAEHVPDVPGVVTPNAESLAAALAASDAVLCHDSFPAHLAAAVGKPVVTVFGSGEPDWFAPWDNRDRVVQRRVCPLHPCIDRCGMDSYLCLDAVGVDDAAVQVMKLAAAP